MSLFQKHKAGVTPYEAGTSGDEHALAHVFNRFDLLILNQALNSMTQVSHRADWAAVSASRT